MLFPLTYHVTRKQRVLTESASLVPALNISICKEDRLFVYDAPSAFTTDLLTENQFELVPGTKYAQWQSEYYLHQSLKEHPCTTSNPEEAQIFYVPLYGSGMRGSGSKDRYHIKHVVFTWLRSQKSRAGVSYFERKAGRDHVLSLGASRSWCKPNNPAQRTAKCLGFSHQELFYSNFIKLSVEYTGLKVEQFFESKSKERLSRIIIVPYVHFDVKSAFGHIFSHKDVGKGDHTYGRRRTLLAFSGSLLPKTAPFRAFFKEICDMSTECVYQSNQNSRQLINTEESLILYKNSTFCAILGGDTRASKRLFDAISSLCIPVIFDPLLALPFEADIPYEKITISAGFISKRDDVQNTIDKLNRIPDNEIRRMQVLLLKYMSRLSYFNSDETNAVDMIFKRLSKVGQALYENDRERLEVVSYSDWNMMHQRLCSNADKRHCKIRKFRTQTIV